MGWCNCAGPMGRASLASVTRLRQFSSMRRIGEVDVFCSFLLFVVVVVLVVVVVVVVVVVIPFLSLCSLQRCFLSSDQQAASSSKSSQVKSVIYHI